MTNSLARAIGAKSSINIKPSHKGLLHQSLGVPQGQKIPVSMERKAANSTDPVLRRRAQFALNAAKFNR